MATSHIAAVEALEAKSRRDQEALKLADALAAAVDPTHSMPRHKLPGEWPDLIRAIQQAALNYRAARTP